MKPFSLFLLVGIVDKANKFENGKEKINNIDIIIVNIAEKSWRNLGVMKQ